MAKVKARRTHREELPGIALLRDSVATEITAHQTRPAILDLDMEVDPNLRHLMDHDPDGFFTAVESDETLGFGAAFIRARQCFLSELWVLPQHQGKGAGELLLKKTLLYGDRSGAREFLALVPCEPVIQSLLLRYSFKPLTPVYQFHISRQAALPLADAMANLFSGRNATSDLLDRRGQADIDRIDQVTRGITREVDHTYWLKERSFNAALVRQGDRIAGYGYGVADQVGPVAGSSRDAALCALGWGLQLALADGAQNPLIRVPAPFGAAIRALQEAGARLHSTLMLYGINVSAAFDRCVLGVPNLP